MIELMNQCFGLINDAIDRADNSRLHQYHQVDSASGNGGMTSLHPATATPSLEVHPVANAGDGMAIAIDAGVNQTVVSPKSTRRSIANTFAGGVGSIPTKSTKPTEGITGM